MESAFETIGKNIIEDDYIRLNYELNGHVLWLRKSNINNKTIILLIKSQEIEVELYCGEDIQDLTLGHINITFERDINNNITNENIGKAIYNTIKSLKFNKYFGTYVELQHMKTIEAEIKLFPEFFKDRICSVCLEHTETHPFCKHFLCYLCWGKIIKDGNCRCPQCRNCIKIQNVEECCDEECKCQI